MKHIDTVIGANSSDHFLVSTLLWICFRLVCLCH